MRPIPAFALALALLAGCGRVGDPLPPFVRVPEAVSDLAVGQNAYNLRFAWTTPRRNVDSSASTDLAFAEVLADGAVAGRVEAVPGEAQVLELDARALVGMSRTYSVRFVTEADRFSEPSNTIEFTVLEVPEGAGSPGALVDQGRIRLSWNEPLVRPELVTEYRVYRSGELLAASVPATSFEDLSFDRGAEYTYRVVPVRAVEARIVEGVAYADVVVEASDRTAPGAPANPLAVVDEDGAFLRWNSAAETDVSGYRVYQGAEATPVGESVTTAFYVAGAETGEVFRVTAVDDDGNESALSAPVMIP